MYALKAPRIIIVSFAALILSIVCFNLVATSSAPQLTDDEFWEQAFSVLESPISENDKLYIRHLVEARANQIIKNCCMPLNEKSAAKLKEAPEFQWEQRREAVQMQQLDIIQQYSVPIEKEEVEETE